MFWIFKRKKKIITPFDDFEKFLLKLIKKYKRGVKLTPMKIVLD